MEGSDDPEAELADNDVVCQPFGGRAASICEASNRKSHTTQPPNRYSEAALTRALEEMGIGRPSTYASIIDTILARDYVFKLKRDNVLVPTWTAFAVSQLLKPTCPNWSIISLRPRWKTSWTPSAAARLNHLDYLRNFYFGNGHPGLKQLLAEQGRRNRRPRRRAAFCWDSRRAKASERADLRPRRPLRAVPGTRRAPGEPARRHAPRRS